MGLNDSNAMGRRRAPLLREYVFEVLAVLDGLLFLLLLFELGNEFLLQTIENARQTVGVDERAGVVGLTGMEFGEQAELAGMRGEIDVAWELAQHFEGARVIVH